MKQVLALIVFLLVPFSFAQAFTQGFNPISGTDGNTVIFYNAGAITNAAYGIDGSFLSQIGAGAPCDSPPLAAQTFQCNFGINPVGSVVHVLDWNDGSYPGNGVPYSVAVTSATFDYSYTYGFPNPMTVAGAVSLLGGSFTGLGIILGLVLGTILITLVALLALGWGYRKIVEKIFDYQYGWVDKKESDREDREGLRASDRGEKYD